MEELDSGDDGTSSLRPSASTSDHGMQSSVHTNASNYATRNPTHKDSQQALGGSDASRTHNDRHGESDKPSKRRPSDCDGSASAECPSKIHSYTHESQSQTTDADAPYAPQILCPTIVADLDAQVDVHLQSLSGCKLTDFELREVIGTGTFGRVQVCRCQKNANFYAMKIMKKLEVVRLKQVEHINTEKRILNQLRHPFIVTLYCSFQDDRSLYMLLEYINGGEIFSHLRRMGRFAPEAARFYSAQIVLILEYLHSLDIVYRDLKPENLLLDRQGYLKITDFGFAKVVIDRTWTLCGTPEYLAPEIIQSKGHGKGVDWWALGVLIYEMLVGYPPFFDDHPFGVYEKILSGKIQFPVHVDNNAKDLVKRLLTSDRTKRLGNLRGGAEDIKQHKWFRDLDWGKLLRRELVAPIRPVVRDDADTSNFERYPMPADERSFSQPDPFQSLFKEF